MNWLRHWRCRVLIGAHLDHELSALEHQRVTRHLGECPTCASDGRMLAAIQRSLRRSEVQPQRHAIACPGDGVADVAEISEPSGDEQPGCRDALDIRPPRY